MRRSPLAALIALTLAACGGEETQAPPPAETTPEPAATVAPQQTAPTQSTASPAIISIAVDPGDGTVMIGTGPALYRLPAGADEAEHITGTITTPQGTADVSGNTVMSFAGPGDLLGSGHPQGASALPENLGLMRSSDLGNSWESVSGLGEGDYHELEAVGDLILAVNVESPDILVSRDGGQTWETRTPPAPPIDVVVDPDDPQRWAVSTEQGTFTSADAGGSWRPRDSQFGSRLVWPAGDALYSLERNGIVRVSEDGGRTYTERGDVDGIPSVVAAGQKDELYAGVVGGKVLRSADGGASWETVTTLR